MKGIKHIAGASMVETLLALPIILMMGMGVVHLGLIYQAKSNLEYAALMAARVGASTSIDIEAMRKEVKRRMKAADSISGDVGDVSNVTIEVLNPTKTVFDDWGGPGTDGVNCSRCEIPNDNLYFRPKAPEGVAGLNIQDANLLRIRVKYYYDTKVPFMQNFHMDHINDGEVVTGMELVAVSTVRMQSPARLTGNNESYILD